MVKQGKFHVAQLLNQRSMEQLEAEEGSQKEEIIMVDVYDLEPSKENFYLVDDNLKRSIDLVGILQPLLVNRPEHGRYKVIAGHRRRLAVLSLVEEGNEKRRYVPCVFKKEDIRDHLAIIMANRFRDKTDWEKMMEAVEAEELAKELKKDYKLEGRTREVLAEITGVSEAQLGRYKAIFNNLDRGLMDEFKAGRMGLSVAYELCGLPEEWQGKAKELIQERGMLSLMDIKELRDRKAREEKEAWRHLEASINQEGKWEGEMARDKPGKEETETRQAESSQPEDNGGRKAINREPEGKTEKNEEKEDSPNIVYTHDFSAQIVELFENLLEKHDITIPSPEDGQKEPDNHSRIYGSVYSDLLGGVEAIVKEMLKKVETKKRRLL